MTEPQVIEALHALKQSYYFDDVVHGLGQSYPSALRISNSALDRYLSAYRPREYVRAQAAVLGAVVNRNEHMLGQVLRSTGVHEAIVRLVVKQLEIGGHAIVRWHNAGATIMKQPTIGRVLRGLEAEVMKAEQ